LNCGASWRQQIRRNYPKTLMQTMLQVLSEAERTQVHVHSLDLLSKVGVRVETAWGRDILAEAGAQVDAQTHIVRFPPQLVEACLKQAPRQFSLGGRRAGYSLPMNAGHCALLVDGGAMFVYDAEKKMRRNATHADWVKATRLVDALDEIDLYWWMVREDQSPSSRRDFVTYWQELFSLTSKHIQDATETREQSRWLIEILQVVFGDRKTIRRVHPLSFLVCPVSPLTIEGAYADAYLELIGWDIPLAVMPMPLMGTTAPGRLIATVVQGNCEVLAYLCLVQATSPGTPFIYAPALAVAQPHSGRYGSGAIEHALLGAAVTEMGRFYGLPVETSTGGTDHHVPSIQAGYERALNWSLPVLSWPDILVGPGLLSGSTILSFEQLIIDIEIFQRCKRLARGIDTGPNRWLEEVIERVGPGGNYLAQRSTREALRSGEWHLSELGVQAPYETWEASGKDLLAEAREKIDRALADHQPLPLDEAALRELQRIEACARE
jgi:trimethylamine--corrinoid protein Co-methyltransferase